jgi:hypothetical protein
MPRRPALHREPNSAIERRLADLEAKEPLDLDTVGRAIGHIRRPDVLADRLAEPLRYSQRVEAEVAGMGIEVLLPYAKEDGDHVGRFLTVWVPDELGHAEALDRLLAHLEVEPAAVGVDEGTVPLHNRVAGTLGRLSSRAYEMVSHTYHVIGAVNERLALAAYTRMAEVAQEVGETELAKVLLAKLRRDESAHLGYYRTHARQLRARLAPWQRRAVRALVVHTYAPVGAGRDEDKAPMGRVLTALEDDPDNPSIGDVVHDLAVDLLAEPGQDLPPFVHRALQDCLDRSRAEAQALVTAG